MLELGGHATLRGRGEGDGSPSSPPGAHYSKKGQPPILRCNGSVVAVTAILLHTRCHMALPLAIDDTCFCSPKWTDLGDRTVSPSASPSTTPVGPKEES